MLVNDVMITQVVTISPFATLRQALSLMKQRKLKSLVVEKTAEHDAYGLITYTNIMKTVVAESGDIDLINVYDICVKPVITVGKSLSLKHVASLMTNHAVKRVVVVEDNTMVGLVCMNDIVHHIMQSID